MISQLYIEKILQLYSLTDRQKGELLKRAEEIDNTFSAYAWDDVENGINEFFKKKSTESYPTPKQIYAFVSTNKKAKKSEKSDVEEIVKPYTNIKLIEDCYFDVCRLKYLYGIAYSEYFDKVMHLPYGNKMRALIKTAPTGEKEYKLINLTWIWEDALVEAKKQQPAVFEKFKYATENELYALAYKLGFLKLDLNKGKNLTGNSN